MITNTQKTLYKLCGVTPIEFWTYTPAETNIMIEAAVENRTEESDFNLALNARLCAVILNANGVQKKNKKPFEMKDFLPEENSKRAPHSVEDIELMIRNATIAAGGNVS